MKYIRSLVSNAILFYLFDDSELGEPHKSIKKLSNMYDDIEDYLAWAEARLEELFYQCSDSEWSMAEKIRRIDQRLLLTFPFLYRIVDRSYLIERFLTALELFDIESEESSNCSITAQAYHSPWETDKPIDVLADEPKLEKASGVEEIDVRIDVPAADEPIDEPADEPDEPAADEPSTDAWASSFCPAPVVPIPVRQSVHKLRRIADRIGIRNAFLLSSIEAQKKLALYNDGKLSTSELKQI